MRKVAKHIFFLRLYGKIDPKYTLDIWHSLKISRRLDFKDAEYYMIFGTSKQLFAKTVKFQEKRRPETCTVYFVDTNQVFVVRAFSSLLATVMIAIQ